MTDIVSRLAYRDIERDVREVVRRLAIIEREVKVADGGTFLMRVRPYRKVNKVVDGVVVTFVDITERASADEHSKLLMAELDHRVKKHADNGTVARHADGTERSTMGAFLESFEARLGSLFRDAQPPDGQPVAICHVESPCRR